MQRVGLHQRLRGVARRRARHERERCAGQAGLQPGSGRVVDVVLCGLLRAHVLYARCSEMLFGMPEAMMIWPASGRATQAYSRSSAYQSDEGQVMRYLHTMVRVTDLDASLRFYCDALGLRELRRVDHEQGRFTLIFLAAPGDERAQVELTFNWDPQD